MFLAISSALLLGTTGAPFVGSFGGHDRVIEGRTRWERFDLVVTNTTDAERRIGLCPGNAEMTQLTSQGSSHSAFAVKFDDEGWSFSCDEKSVAAGESVTIGVFFRPRYEPGTRRSVTVDTSVGSFIIGR